MTGTRPVFTETFCDHSELAARVTDDYIADLIRQYPPPQYTARVDLPTFTVIVEKRRRGSRDDQAIGEGCVGAEHEDGGPHGMG